MPGEQVLTRVLEYAECSKKRRFESGCSREGRIESSGLALLPLRANLVA